MSEGISAMTASSKVGGGITLEYLACGTQVRRQNNLFW